MKVVVVESPSKAKTINKYLGSEYTVLASFGHVRDLPSKNGSVDPENNFAMLWETESRSTKHINDIAAALKGADTLYLATDPDREGEAISWHIREVLEKKKKLKGINVQRIVFHEITKKAVQNSLMAPRDLDQGLIDAYLARRALDYLVGFTLSPILWTRLPGCRSAGRVQSVALRLVADRETEIDAFKAEEYWSLTATFSKENNKTLGARLTHVNGEKLEKFSLQKDSQALPLKEEAEQQSYSVIKIEKKKAKRNPAAPFITSTLQQEASRKLRFSARKTMQLAQRLYEGIQIGGETVGLITYMRTDSVTVSTEAISGARDHIQKIYGDSYLPKSPRLFKSKTKNAQEAHEAIRPTSVTRHPADLKALLDKDQFALYDLVWKRFLASQMETMILDQVAVDIESHNKKFIFRANGSTIAFDGFLRVYVEGRDEEDGVGDDDEKLLPPLSDKEILSPEEVLANQHFTQPPPRYSEASLVKKLEELGIGRPSTYASIISTLLERKYVRLDKRQLHPESLGRLVTAFLSEYFTRYLEYDFTANLEERLDDVSNGEHAYLKVLEDFWIAFKAATKEADKLRITDVLNLLEVNLKSYIFPEREDNSDPKSCPNCKEGDLSLRLGKFGGFVGCSRYPDCSYTRQLSTNLPEGEDAAALAGAFETKILGQDPKSGLEITLRKGPYGFYYQWGEAEKKKKPKRVSLPKGTSPDGASLEQALDMGALPRVVGDDPETGDEITAALGRFGPYVKRGSTFASLAKEDDPLTVTLPRALELFEIAKEKALKKAAAKKEAGGTGASKKATTKKTATTAKKTTTKKTATAVKKTTVKKTATTAAKKTTVKKTATTAKKTTTKKTATAVKKNTARKTDVPA